jgi:hypothetical protein
LIFGKSEKRIHIFFFSLVGSLNVIEGDESKRETKGVDEPNSSPIKRVLNLKK